MIKEPKRRSAPAVDAWSRHGGAHNPGSKRPDVDDTEEGLDEFLLEVCGTLEIDGELYEIEWLLDEEEGEEDGEE